VRRYRFDHSEIEARFILVGHSLAGRLLLVVHAEKEGGQASREQPRPLVGELHGAREHQRSGDI
jgi:hypothetical protein